MDKHVSIDSKPRNTVTIDVAGKSFCISRVVIGARKLFGDLLKDIGDNLSEIGKLTELLDSSDQRPDDWEQKTNEQLKKAQEFSADKLDRYLRTIDILLTKNGYEFDRQWWEENCDETDYQFFIIECMNKDVGPSKKKAMEKSTIIK